MTRGEANVVDTIKDGDISGYDDFDNRYLAGEQGFGIKRDAVKSIPVVDLAPFIAGGTDAQRKSVAQELRKACIDVGFFYLAGHGFSATELDDGIKWGHKFFELPLEQKMTLHVQGPGLPGFMRVGGIDPDKNPDKAADLKERFIMSRERFPDETSEVGFTAGQSRWPSEEMLPGFATFMKEHLAKRVVLSQALARAFALSLDLSEDFFDSYYHRLGVVSIINYYPPLSPETAKKTQWSFSPHTDYGGFTLLSQDSLGGLQVRNSAGEWINVPPIEGTFVVNIGDLMATWTNDLYKSNLHRAANVSNEARISIPFFASPQGSSMIQCLDTCQSASNPPRYAPVTAGQYVRTLIEQADRTGRPGISQKTADRMRKSTAA
jgi:isopenicillin N synthase-like dioxygenase